MAVVFTPRACEKYVPGGTTVVYALKPSLAPHHSRLRYSHKIRFSVWFMVVVLHGNFRGCFLTSPHFRVASGFGRVTALQKEVAEQERLREERRRTKRLLKAEKARIEAQGAAAGGVFGPRYYIGYSAYSTVVPRKRGL